MPVRCLNPRCARELRDDWAFCNWCGTDNRPPAARIPVEEDEHLAPESEHCVRCGVSILDVNRPPDEDEHRLQAIGGWIALILGGGALVASYAIRPGGHRGIAFSESDSHAASIAFLCARYGSLLMAGGVVLLLVTPVVRRRR